MKSHRPSIKAWQLQLKELSGNLTTNAVMPQKVRDKLLEEDMSLKDKLSFKEIDFVRLNGILDSIEGLHILSGLQKIHKKGYLTLFRAVRFPTYKRMYEMLSKDGYAISNYEQERIVELYTNIAYIKKRKTIKEDPLFWIQPQERVVRGLPLFCLVNDALQIHRAFRGTRDNVVIIAIHIPHVLFETGKLKLIANTAIDLDYEHDERDMEIKDFYREGDMYEIDYEALRARGIDLHEMYTKDLPVTIDEAHKIGVKQEYFLLDIYKIKKNKNIDVLWSDTKTLKNNSHFLHGFFGDHNIFGRRRTEYLPVSCWKINLSK